jgi:hypothetical protein
MTIAVITLKFHGFVQTLESDKKMEKSYLYEKLPENFVPCLNLFLDISCDYMKTQGSGSFRESLWWLLSTYLFLISREKRLCMLI